MRRPYAFFLILILILIQINVCASSNEFYYSFEDESDAVFWNGCWFDESAAFDSNGGIIVNNPFGEVKNDLVTHVLEYDDKIYLEAGKTYTISGMAMNPLSSQSSYIRCRGELSPGSNTVIIYVNGIGSDWSEFSATFYASESGEFNLSVYFEKGNSDFGFFADEIKLCETQCTISSVKLLGQTSAIIPVSNDIKISYYPVLVTTDETYIYPLSKDVIYAQASDAQGISFDSSTFTLTITPQAIPESTVTINYALRDSAVISPGSLTVTLSDNLISNSDFEQDDPLGYWSGSGLSTETEDGNTFLSIGTNDYNEYGYFTTIDYEFPQLLVEGEMYVLRAKIKSSVDKRSAIYATNYVRDSGSFISFCVNDISGTDWYDVSVAFIPEVSGVYSISLSLFSQYDCSIYVDDIRLCAEKPRANSITVHAPGNITVPRTEVSYPLYALVRDQLGSVLENESCSISIFGPDEIIYNSNNTITILPTTQKGEYTVSVYCDSNNSISSELSFEISENYIGDGTFENKIANEWWMVNSPYYTVFNIDTFGASKSANIACDGDYFLFINNSYAQFTDDVPYVFSGDIVSACDAEMTAFITLENNENIPLFQIKLDGGVPVKAEELPEIFLSEGTFCGRLLFYFQSANGEPISVNADNFSIREAKIKASSPFISGDFFVNGAAKADFEFVNTVTNSSDKSACVINWYYADSLNAEFIPLSVSGEYIYFDTSFTNKYVYFDVTPVCPVTGFSGETLKSEPIFVSLPLNADNNETPNLLPSGEVGEDNKKPDALGNFADTENHWASDCIGQLAKLNIVSGKGNNIFDPDSPVTRAEISRMLTLAFEIETDNISNSFVDVNSNDWFYTYVNALSRAEIVFGKTNTEFMPYDNVTREEAAVLMLRIYKHFNRSYISGTGQYNFNDDYAISDWAKAAVSDAAALSLAHGDEYQCFHPKNNVTRAEAAAFICRLMVAVEDYKD